ncbi:hypothetical protein Tco_1032734 [Tanacetum coccineum]|uniref:Uncharacterized protein n=1 Tax=Tanacetum coccineum TaxID=301880 RepID=A0ABQ5GF49_9ASTR
MLDNRASQTDRPAKERLELPKVGPTRPLDQLETMGSRSMDVVVVICVVSYYVAEGAMLVRLYGRLTRVRDFWVLKVTDIQEKDKNRSQNDKTEHENGKSVKEKSKLKPSQKIKVNKVKPKSTPGSGIGKSIENRTRKPKLPKVGPPVPT